MRSSKEYREKAREALSGNYSVVVGAYIIYTIILNVLSAPLSIISTIGEITGLVILTGILSIPFSLLTTLVSTLFVTGANKIVYDVTKGEKAEFMNLFYCFSHNPLTVVCAELWILLYLLPAFAILFLGLGIGIFLIIMIGSPAAVLAGAAVMIIALIAYLIYVVILSLSVSMAFFMYYDDPSMKAHDLIKGSMAMMKGNKFRLFKLNLSYLGYYLLGFLSCGLALLWINPNVTAAAAFLYRDLRSPEQVISADDPVSPESPSNSYYHQDYWN